MWARRMMNERVPFTCSTCACSGSPADPASVGRSAIEPISRPAASRPGISSRTTGRTASTIAACWERVPVSRRNRGDRDLCQLSRRE